VPHALIRDGAPLVRGAADVVEALGLDAHRLAGGRAENEPAGADPEGGLSLEERRVLGVVPGSPVTLDAVAGAVGLPVPSALRALGALELRGLVSASGGRYRRSAAVAGSVGELDRT
jgi:DNA processing protein